MHITEASRYHGVIYNQLFDFSISFREYTPFLAFVSPGRKRLADLSAFVYEYSLKLY